MGGVWALCTRIVLTRSRGTLRMGSGVVGIHSIMDFAENNVVGLSRLSEAGVALWYGRCASVISTARSLILMTPP